MASKTPPTSATTSTGSDQEIDFLQSVLRAETGALDRIAEGLPHHADAWRSAIQLIAECEGHVVVAGMGKSGLVGAKISATLSSLGRPSHTIHPAEAVHGDLGRIRRGDVAILLSYSGETEEAVALASILATDEIACIGISRSDETTLGRLCRVHLPLGTMTEACPLNLAPTASTTATTNTTTTRDS